MLTVNRHLEPLVQDQHSLSSKSTRPHRKNINRHSQITSSRWAPIQKQTNLRPQKSDTIALDCFLILPESSTRFRTIPEYQYLTFLLFISHSALQSLSIYHSNRSSNTLCAATTHSETAKPENFQLRQENHWILRRNQPIRLFWSLVVETPLPSLFPLI